jgi:hypothetical protein
VSSSNYVPLMDHDVETVSTYSLVFSDGQMRASSFLKKSFLVFFSGLVSRQRPRSIFHFASSWRHGEFLIFSVYLYRFHRD